MTSTIIYKATAHQIATFKPTYLYLKQHGLTGMLYFGQTRKNPTTYKGSGKYWVDHINKHGDEHVKTIWFCLFTDIECLIQTAVSLSEIMDIVNSKVFANLIVENGLTGSPRGKQLTEEQRQRMRTNHWSLKEKYRGKNNPNYGSKRNVETCRNISQSKIGKSNKLKGIPKPKELCERWSQQRKGKLPKNVLQQSAAIQLRRQIFEIYNSKPVLEGVNTKAKNGRLLTYNRLFANTYCQNFNLTSAGLMNIITTVDLYTQQIPEHEWPHSFK